MNHQLISIGILIIFIGFAMVFISAFTGQKSETKVAVGGLIGFIPFGFSNDKRLLWVILGLTALLALFWFFTQFQVKHP
ncbi:MAG: hypothetical protein IH947_07640 [Bacteroidetes bacterium]|nr:hypothetical protein [Bacteroidota bacterium]